MGTLRSILVALLVAVSVTACGPLSGDRMPPPPEEPAVSVDGGGGATDVGDSSTEPRQVPTETGNGGDEGTAAGPPVAADEAEPGGESSGDADEEAGGAGDGSWVITGTPYGHTDDPYWIPDSAAGDGSADEAPVAHEPSPGQGRAPTESAPEPRQPDRAQDLPGGPDTSTGDDVTTADGGGRTLHEDDGSTTTAGGAGGGIGMPIHGIGGGLGHGGGTETAERPSPKPSPSSPSESTDRVPEESGTVESAEPLAAAIDAYLDRLPSAAYTFNPPSPIKVAKPRTVYLWLDPEATPEGLAAELREAVPEDAARVESGETQWSPIMEATLTGSAFEIEAVRPERQSVSSTHRTTWAWEVTATEVGKRLPLHLTLNVILPPDLGPPHTIEALDRRIDVEVTLWWAFDHYFDRYWKWLLGGLGTSFAGVVAWWWKRRDAAVAESAGS
jgi:hypothetical protein